MASVLVVGCGSIGKRHLRLLLASPRASTVCICEPAARARATVVDEFGLRADQAFGDLKEALTVAKPSAVVLCTPPEMHVPQAIMALQHDCHVLTEKPLSDGLTGVPQLVAARNVAERVVMVALCFRFHAGAVRTRELLQQGKIGELVAVRAMMGEPFALIRPDDYRTMFVGKRGSTGAFDLIHDIDLACWLASSQRPRIPTRVRGLAGCYGRTWPNGAPDTAEVLVDFRASDGSESGGVGGVAASVHLDFFQSPRRRAVELLGSEGVLILEFSSWEKCSVSYCNRTNGAGPAGVCYTLYRAHIYVLRAPRTACTGCSHIYAFPPHHKMARAMHRTSDSSSFP